MSYNVNFGFLYEAQESEGANSVANAIRKNSCDVVFLQETNENYEQFFSDKLSDIYPYQLFRHSQNWCAGGMGLLSKLPFQELHWIPAKSQWFHGWIVEVETPLGTIQFLNTHLRPPIQAGNSMIPSPFAFYSSKDERKDDLQTWFPYLDIQKKIIILGDFNESHRGLFYGKAIGWLESPEMGFRDAIDEWDSSITWEWPLPMNMKLSANFDHIFYRKSELHCLSASVKREGASDHFPVVAEFRIIETNRDKEDNSYSVGSSSFSYSVGSSSFSKKK